jgi:adenine-specific DNA-methyltransferase
LAKRGYRVISSDIAVWSEVFGTCYLLNDKRPTDYAKLIKHLNSLKPIDGWFTEHYGGLPNDGGAIQADGLKKPWQIHNTRKLDAIREEIKRLALPPLEKAVALTSLMLALERVDSTLGHCVSYLQDWAPRSYNELHLKMPRLFMSDAKHCVQRGDVFELAPSVEADPAYFDPPYGSNDDKMPPSRVRYASYYHLWTSVCLFDKPPLFGKTKRRKDTFDPLAASVFEDFRRNQSGRFIAVEAVDRLLRLAKTRWIILSYSSGGRATAEELQQVLEDNGRILDVIEVDCKKNVMADMRWTNQWIKDSEAPNREFLFFFNREITT